MTATATAPPRVRTSSPRKGIKSSYPTWFYIPSAVLYVILFAVPTFASFYFSLTRWSLFDIEFIGFDNYVQFFTEPMLMQGFVKPNHRLTEEHILVRLVHAVRVQFHEHVVRVSLNIYACLQPKFQSFFRRNLTFLKA